MQRLLQHVEGCGYLFTLRFVLFASLGFRQGFLVHLLVLVERDAFYLHGHGRHHVRRLLVENEIVKCLNVNLLVSHDVGCNELAIATLLVKSLHGSVLNARELTDDGLHLFQFDAEATNLHLSVAASNKLDVAIGQVADDVTGAVNALIFTI